MPLLPQPDPGDHEDLDRQVDGKLQQAHHVLGDTLAMAQDNVARALAISAQERHLENQCEILEQEAREFEKTSIETRKRSLYNSRRNIVSIGIVVLVIVLLAVLILLIKL